MIKLLILDIDGTLTDGKVHMGINGEIMKTFNIKDGYGIASILPKLSIKPVVITGRKSKIVEKRCAELNVTEVYQGVHNKSEKLAEIVEKYGVLYSELAYIGDDDNDLECMSQIKQAGGVVACPADASKNVLAIANFVSTKNGGEGSVREFIDTIIKDEGGNINE